MVSTENIHASNTQNEQVVCRSTHTYRYTHMCLCVHTHITHTTTTTTIKEKQTMNLKGSRKMHAVHGRALVEEREV